ncbi:MAG: ABC transporter permease [Alistipes sp.]|nr:ABC transporter permease [Candidatus Alistipes equi]
MNKFIEYFKLYATEVKSVMRNEYRSIFSDPGVMLILIFALIIYSVIYSLVYRPEVLTDVNIAVVDESHTHSSVQLTRAFDWAPNTHVSARPLDMEEAKRMFDAHEIYGIVHIPKDFEEQIMSGRQSAVSVYCDASYFLMYRQVFQDVVATIMKAGAFVELQRLMQKGVNLPQAKAVTQPIIYQSHTLFNPYLGYGTYVMPPIMLLIIQQTALIAIGMIGGTWREYNLYRSIIPKGRDRLSSIPVVAGKAITYVLIYATTIAYIFGVHYRLFNYPTNGNVADCVAVIIPYLLSCIFMGITISTIFSKRESSLMWLLWISIPSILISGCSLPKETIPHWLYTIGQVLPSSDALPAYIRVQTMGASFNDVVPEVSRLWIKVFIYGATALISMDILLHRNFATKLEKRLLQTRIKLKKDLENIIRRRNKYAARVETTEEPKREVRRLTIDKSIFRRHKDKQIENNSEK